MHGAVDLARLLALLLAVVASPSYLPVITVITNPDGQSFAPVAEMRFLAGMSAEIVTGDGPDRIEVGYDAAVASISGTLPIVVSGGSAPVVSINAATESTRGTLSGQDKAKLNTVGTGATVASITAGTGIAVTGTAAVPIVSATASSDVAPGTMSAANYTKLSGITAGAAVASVTAGTAVTLTGTATAPVVNVDASSGSVPGTMSAANFTKLAGIGVGATVASIGSGTCTTVGGTAAVPTVNVVPSSGSVPGSMSSAHYTLVNNASVTDTASTIVMRSASNEIYTTTVNAVTLNAGGVTTTETLEVGADETGAAIFHCAISTTARTNTYGANLAVRGIEGGHHEVTLTGNITFDAPTNYSSDPELEIFVIQGGTGSYTASWAIPGSGGFSFPTGLSGTLIATSVGDVDYFRFKHRSAPTSHWVCTAHLKYSPP
jgi:hypothetical protein